MSRLPQPPKRANNAISNSTVLYIGLIPFEWDENNIRSLACGTGNVVDVRMGFDYVGKNKGFCFIEYQTSQEIPRALEMLSQVRVNKDGKVKRLRIEQSKEGLRLNPGADNKQVLQLNRNYLPANVQLPPEMMTGSPMVGQNMGQMNMANQMGGPMGGQMGGQMNMGGQMAGQMNMGNQIGGQMNMGNQMGGPMNVAQPGFMGNNSRNSRNLPLPPTLPFKVTDKINENLSHLPPPQLIDLITNLKEILSGPYANRASEMFQMSPFLATNAAQALLLMGLIDEDVIQESSKNPQFNSTPQMSQPNYSTPPPPPPAMPIAPEIPQESKWPYLPYQTQQKLSQMAPEQANLIAQVLTIPQEQIPTLEPDKQAMVVNLRAQYL